MNYNNLKKGIENILYSIQNYGGDKHLMSHELSIEITDEIIQEIKNEIEESGQLDTMVSLREGLKKATEALDEINKYNQMRNDLQSYLYDVADWALGNLDQKPNPKDYGVGQSN